jgi:hypothetical protein
MLQSSWRASLRDDQLTAGLRRERRTIRSPQTTIAANGSQGESKAARTRVRHRIDAEFGGGG